MCVGRLGVIETFGVRIVDRDSRLNRVPSNFTWYFNSWVGLGERKNEGYSCSKLRAPSGVRGSRKLKPSTFVQTVTCHGFCHSGRHIWRFHSASCLLRVSAGCIDCSGRYLPSTSCESRRLSRQLALGPPLLRPVPSRPSLSEVYRKTQSPPRFGMSSLLSEFVNQALSALGLEIFHQACVTVLLYHYLVCLCGSGYFGIPELITLSHWCSPRKDLAFRRPWLHRRQPIVCSTHSPSPAPSFTYQLFMTARPIAVTLIFARLLLSLTLVFR